MTKRFLTILICLISKFSFAQNWIFVTKSTDGTSFYIRSSSISQTYIKKVWTKESSKSMIYYKNGKNHTLLNGYAVALFEYNCDTKQSNLLSKTYYNSKGTPVNNYKVAYYDEVWTDVIPDSVGEELLNKACELF